MTKHSISCAEYPHILKSASFRIGTFGGTLIFNIIYYYWCDKIAIVLNIIK